MPTTNKTRTISFRISAEFERALRSQASGRALSLNAYVIESLRRGLEWGPLFDRFEFLHLSKPILIALLESIDEKNLVRIATEIATPLLKEMANSMYGSAGYDALKQLMELLAKYEYAWPVVYSRFDNGKGGERVVIRHGVCREWSIFVGEVLKRYLDDLGFMCKSESTSNSTILDVIPKKSHAE